MLGRILSLLGKEKIIAMILGFLAGASATYLSASAESIQKYFCENPIPVVKK